MAEKRKIKESDIFYFYNSGKQFLKRTTRPSRKEFMQLLKAEAIGILSLGFLGYFIKLIHILINDVLVPDK